MDLTTLKPEQIIDIVNSITNGRIERITYKSEMPLRAENKKAGFRLTKVTAVSARFGIDYDNLPSVIEKRANEDYKPREVTNNYEWVVKDKIAHHTKNDNYYVRITHLPEGNNRRNLFILENNGEEQIVDKLTDEMKDLVINSYWNNDKGAPEVQNILFNNIIRIGQTGQRIF